MTDGADGHQKSGPRIVLGSGQSVGASAGMGFSRPGKGSSKDEYVYRSSQSEAGSQGGSAQGGISQ